MKPRLISVPHSGTRFLQKVLEPHFPGVIAEHWLKYRQIMAAFDGDLVVVPIRNPYDVYVGWWKRNKMGPEYFDSWKVLNEAFEYVPALLHFVPIDLPSRDLYLADLAEALELNLETDWERTGHYSKMPSPPPPIDLSEVYRLPVVEKFYGLPEKEDVIRAQHV